MKVLHEKLFADNIFVIVTLLLVGCVFLSVVIPPLQSPDEHDHIERAYLLGKNVLILDRPEGSSSGGNIDTGLLEYLTSYLPSQDKFSAEEIESASEIRWTGQRKYDPSPGTGFYFPVIYLPQAAGLYMGEQLGLTVDHSYRLSRAFSLFVVVLLVFAAFRIYSPNPLVLALIVIPMSLFQFSSASLDGISNALTIFSIAVFMRISNDKRQAPNWTQYALAISIMVLATSRIHEFPIVFLLAASFFYTRDKKALYLFIVSTLFIVGWTFFTIKTTVDLRVSASYSASDIIAFYLHNPFQFLTVLWNTISDQYLRDFYCRSFLGVLGWLDASFEAAYYTYFGILILIIAALSISFRNIKEQWQQRLLLISISLMSTLLIFFALLVNWSPHPAEQISGIQGRYFLIPVIFFAYGIAGNGGFFDCFCRKVATILCVILFIFSIAASTSLLLHRYYLTPFNIGAEKVVHRFDDPNGQVKMVPSPVLGEDAPIVLNMPLLEENNFGKLRKIGIYFGTYMRQNPGKAEIILKTKTGGFFRQEFLLPTLIDNSYKYFKLPPDYYVSGEIRFLSGGGISIWEVRSSNDHVLTCVHLLSTQKQMLFVHGCPNSLSPVKVFHNPAPMNQY